MATSYSWCVLSLERTVSNGYVHTIHYTVEATDGVYRAGAYGSIGLQPPSPEDAIPYGNLTPAVCSQWALDALGSEQVDALQAALQNQIDEQRDPSKAVGIPWDSN